jgi:CBS domain containing-hemolysin-like protein
MLARAGSMMSVGDSIEFNGALFSVESMDRRRIRRVRFTPGETESTDVPSP